MPHHLSQLTTSSLRSRIKPSHHHLKTMPIPWSKRVSQVNIQKISKLRRARIFHSLRPLAKINYQRRSRSRTLVPIQMTLKRASPRAITWRMLPKAKNNRWRLWRRNRPMIAMKVSHQVPTRTFKLAKALNWARMPRQKLSHRWARSPAMTWLCKIRSFLSTGSLMCWMQTLQGSDNLMKRAHLKRRKMISLMRKSFLRLMRSKKRTVMKVKVILAPISTLVMRWRT